MVSKVYILQLQSIIVTIGRKWDGVNIEPMFFLFIIDEVVLFYWPRLSQHLDFLVPFMSPVVRSLISFLAIKGI